MTYSEIMESIAGNLATAFDEVYHSTEIVQTDNGKLPAIVSGDEWISLAPTDQKEIVYIRRNGNDEVYEGFKPGSCLVGYKMRTPLRIVYFRDHADYPDSIIARMLQTVLKQNIKLQSIIRDKWRLLKEESSGDYSLGASTIYLAIDVYAYWDLIPNNCIGNDVCCVDLENPVKKCETVNDNS